VQFFASQCISYSEWRGEATEEVGSQRIEVPKPPRALGNWEEYPRSQPTRVWDIVGYLSSTCLHVLKAKGRLWCNRSLNKVDSKMLKSYNILQLVTLTDKKALLSQRWPRDARYISSSWAVAEIYDGFRRYGNLKFFQDGGGRHLGFVQTGNSAIRSAVPENPTIEQNMKWIGRRVAEISQL